MSGISLRSYHQEIERMIETGRTDEAVAHCRYILLSHPKCVDTYRLLGKAFLESQRYSDATDIFQRVLSSVPDDFVSHVGMSIVREDEGNLDEAIWHMERAFEVQPANGAIQEELRRLYERRDGVQPPKIRLTRGALARMYYKGDLHQQAIAEIRAALAEDINRLDLQLLLSNVYMKAGQRAEAADSASAVLRKLPWCLEANRVMAEALSNTDRQSEAQTFLQRVQALDPYSAHITASSPTSDKVPEQAITLEKLSWKPGQTPEAEMGQPIWAASLGVELEDSAKKEMLPNWLSGITAEKPQEVKPNAVSPFGEPVVPAFTPEAREEEDNLLPDWIQTPVPSTSTPVSDENLPEWMKEAGWEPSAGEAAEPKTSLGLESTNESGEPPLAAAEIPEWLRSMAPPSEAGEAKFTSADEEDVQPWLEKILPSLPADESIPTQPQSEAAITGAQEFAQAPGEESALPDWLAAETASAQADEISEALPDWSLNGEGKQLPAEIELPEAISAEELPDWLLGTEEAQPSVEAVPEEAPAEMELPEAVPAEELPDWLLGIKEAQAPVEAAPEATSFEMELPEAMPVEELPEWLPSIEEAQPSVEAAPETKPVEMELPEAVPAEELPEWLLSTEEAQEPVEAAPEATPFEMELPEAMPVEELPEWLPTIEEAQPSVEAATEATPFEMELPEALPAEELPEWLLSTEEAQASVEAAPEAIPIEMELPEALSTEELPEWLLTAEEQPISETSSVEVAPFEETVPEESLRAEGLPAWLSGVEQERKPGEPAPAELEMTEADKAESAAEEAMAELELPAWLMESEQEIQQSKEEFAILGDTKPSRVVRPGETPPEQPSITVSPPSVPTMEKEISPPETPTQPGFEPESTIPQAPGELSDADAAFAWLESLAVKQGAEEALLLKPEDRMETPPEWVMKEALAGEQPSVAVEPEALATEEEGLPIPEPEAPQVEQPLIESLELVEIQMPVVEEVPPPAQPATEDTEAAFAWLESLAIKQGAEEALLLKPEERREQPPEWVLQEAEAGVAPHVEEALEEIPQAEETSSVAYEAEVVTGEGIITEQIVEAEVETGEEIITEQIVEAEVETGEGIVSEQIVEAEVETGEEIITEQTVEAEVETQKPVTGKPVDIPAFLQGLYRETLKVEAPEPELGTAVIPIPEPEAGVKEEEEALPTEQPATEVQKPDEVMPELPSWLAEAPPESVDTLEWMPPTVVPTHRYDLNQASLVELERLPGIGFIMAQRIVNFRETNGPFNHLEDILQVPGLSETTLTGIKDNLFVEVRPQPDTSSVTYDTLILPLEDVTPELADARRALNEGNLEQAISVYAILIKGGQFLPKVILDLQEASKSYPNEINIWQNLGDAYLRSNQLQEALQAFTKAEELLR